MTIDNRLHRIFSSATWSLLAAFGTYFCMYGFRKPYTASTYEGLVYWGLGYKTILVSAQTIGYALSKFVGIKVISEIKSSKRALGILLLIGFAELMLVAFWLFPAPINVVFIFLNGIPLGMVFGLVLGFLEGRRVSEVLIAGLCASFILADGFTKTIGKELLNLGFTDNQMPVASGALFFIPLLFFVWMLTKIPEPSIADKIHRSDRPTMSKESRRIFLNKYGLTLAGILLAYLLCTLLRSIRADFAPELWSNLGYSNTPSVFSQSELLVTIVIVVLTGLFFLIKSNAKALLYSIVFSILGFMLIAFTVSWLNPKTNGYVFMILIGVGTYLPYVAVHTAVFERFLSITREKANLGFLMYIADTIGYVGYILLMFGKDMLKSNQNFLEFFITISIVISVVSILALGFSYFKINTLLKSKSHE